MPRDAVSRTANVTEFPQDPEIYFWVSYDKTRSFAPQRYERLSAIISAQLRTPLEHHSTAVLRGLRGPSIHCPRDTSLSDSACIFFQSCSKTGSSLVSTVYEGILSYENPKTRKKSDKSHDTLILGNPMNPTSAHETPVFPTHNLPSSQSKTQSNSAHPLKPLEQHSSMVSRGLRE